MKIVHLIQHLTTGGAEKLLVDLALLQSARHQVTVISQYPRLNTKNEERLDDAGIQTYYLNKQRGVDLKNLHQITALLEELSPDVVHTHMHAAIYAIPYYRKHKACAKIHTIHSVANMEMEKHHRIFQYYAYHHLGAVPVSICETVQETVLKEYKITESPIIYNGIDVARFTIPHREPEQFTVINVASFQPWKNQNLLLDAFLLLHRAHPDTRLVFAGDGVQRGAVEQRAKEMGLSSNVVTFLGVSNQVPQLLSESSVFVLCSTFEGMPLSVLEAFSAGLPVVATDVGGIHDVVKNGKTGYLVPSNDANALASRLCELCENRALRQQISGFNRKLAPRFDIQKMAESYEALYRRRLGDCP